VEEESRLSREVNYILNAHRHGLRDRMQALQFLKVLYDGQGLDDQRELCEYLGYILRTETMKTEAVHGVGVNMPALALLALASFGPTGHLAEFIFSRVRLHEPAGLEQWAEEIEPGLKYSLFQYANRFSEQTLTEIKAYCTTFRDPNEALPLAFVQALADLERAVELIELDRFEQALRKAAEKNRTEESDVPSLVSELGANQSVSSAMSEAEQYLQKPGPFDAKIAADLIRTSIDETHGAIVKELEQISGKQIRGDNKDGSRRAYMREVGFISQPEEKFFSSIYTLISEEASHKLIAPKETIMVLHKTASDYLLLLLRRLSVMRRSKPISSRLTAHP
jgi:hypothetical protein